MENKRTVYTDLNMKTSINHTTFLVLNIVFERFQRSIPKHSHGNNSYEIHYIPYGYGNVSIQEQLYRVTPNTLYMTGPHVEHEQFPAVEDPMAEYCIYFKLLKNHTEKEPTAGDVAAQFEAVHFWFGQDTQELNEVFRQIFYELEHQYTGYMIQVEALLEQCIVKIVRNYEAKRPSKQHFAPSNLTDSKYLIVEESFLYDYATLTLEELSRRVGLSTRQTERFLQEYYGKTFLQKRAAAKMSMAAVFLHNDKMSISEISDRLNYSSVQHFSSAFKQYYHISASEYRKNKKEN
jgi:AraC-like DNA-binding protein